MNRHIEDIYKALDIQMKRMSKMQVQIDELRKKFTLTEAGPSSEHSAFSDEAHCAALGT